MAIDMLAKCIVIVVLCILKRDKAEDVEAGKEFLVDSSEEEGDEEGDEGQQEVVGDKEGNPEKGELGADVSGT